MQISQVQTSADLKTFIDLPYQHYRRDPAWIPPLRGEQQVQFNPARNPFLDHCDYARFLLRQDGRAVGRIAAFIDRLAVETWQEPVGLFGHYEIYQREI